MLKPAEFSLSHEHSSFFYLLDYFRAVVADKYINQKNHAPANIIAYFAEKANRKSVKCR